MAPRDVIAVHRLDHGLWVSYLCYATWGAAFAGTGLPNGPVLLAIGANLLLTLAGMAINTAADTGTDAKHRHKFRQAEVALTVGRARIRRWATAEAVAGLALALAAAVWSGRWPVAVAGVLILGLHLLYNLEPVRLKRRGFLGPAAFGCATMALPVVLSFSAAGPRLDPAMWLIVLGLAVLGTGRTALFSVTDRAADAATGFRTPAVRYGTRRALALSCGLSLAGVLLLGGGLWWRHGVLVALAGMLGTGVFLGGMLALPRDPTAVRRMIRYALTPAVFGNLLLLAAAVAAAR
ncbi:hypothetical protein GCM10027521_08730 [Amycolatopsis cihanbeyliensis]